MAPVDLPHLQIYRVKGKAYAYYRRDGRRIRLRGQIGSPELLGAYEAARRAVESAVTVRHATGEAPLPGSLRALVDLYRASPEYRTLAAGSRAGYDRLLTPLLDRFGDLQVAELPRAWVLAMRDELQGTPRTANYRVAVIRRMLSFALDREWRPDNPAMRVKALRTGPGHRVWTDAEIAAMTSAAAGDVRLPVLMALHTAQRQGDILRLVWSAYGGGRFTLRQSKTGIELVIPARPTLVAALEAERQRQQTAARAGAPLQALICTTASGRPWRSDWFKHRFAEVRAAMGLPADLHFHGLRHSAASRLAEAGASDAEIQAVTGHKTRAMVARYTAGARQESLARAGMARLPKHAAANTSGTKVSNAPKSEVSNARQDGKNSRLSC
jgi:integrase